MNLKTFIFYILSDLIIANLTQDVVTRLPDTLQCGVYFGWATVGDSNDVLKMVLSIGWNDYYSNDHKTLVSFMS